MKTKSHSQETKLGRKSKRLLVETSSSPDISKEQEIRSVDYDILKSIADTNYKQGRKDKETEMLKELSHFKTKCVDLMCENDELKEKINTCRKDAIEKIRLWLKENTKGMILNKKTKLKLIFSYYDIEDDLIDYLKKELQ